MQTQLIQISNHQLQEGTSAFYPMVCDQILWNSATANRLSEVRFGEKDYNKKTGKYMC
jgi:hypothetical protein